MSRNGQDVRVACLGQPGYGQVTAGAARGFWRASSEKLHLAGREVPLRLEVNYAEASLLALNFNVLWCWALNKAHRGERVDYFAMLHADVEPQDFWLDSMIRELEERQLDVLGAVVPIKDQNGLTSIALERPDGDSWRVHARLTMHEVYRLPETFTADDVGYPLLLNTGCWVAKFNLDWAKKVRFTINDRIVFSRTANAYVPEVEPEDWNFSRQLNDLGLRIGATRKIPIEHAGSIRFTNGYPWGQREFDVEHVQESVVPTKRPTSDINFPADVDGWLLPAEGYALAELARGKRVLEIGSYCGRSTICLAQTARSVTAIDPHDGRGTPRPRKTRDEFLANLGRFNVLDRVRLHASTDELNGETFDMAFIDGAHDLDSVRADIARVIPRLNPDGLLAFHDYRQNVGEHDGRWDPGVTRAVDELLAEGGELLSTHATVAVVRPPAHVPLEV